MWQDKKSLGKSVVNTGTGVIYVYGKEKETNIMWFYYKDFFRDVIISNVE